MRSCWQTLSDFHTTVRTMNDTPSRFDEETAFRIIDGEVYEVMYDSRGNPYLKRRGVVVDHE